MFPEQRKMISPAWFCVLIIILGVGYFLHANFFARHINVHYTVALGCRGHIQILANCPDGIDLPYVNGVYIYPIPVGGTLRIKGPNPLMDSFYTRTATFEDGTPIPTPTPAASQWHKGQLALIGGSGNDKVVNLFLGTREEYERKYWKLPR